MRKLASIFWLLTLALMSAGFSHGVPVAAPAVVCNFLTGIATGVGAGTCLASPATCNGSDDTAAFNSVASWMVNTWQTSHAGQIELFIPPGSNCSLTTTDITFDGVKDLIVIGYGARLDGTYFHLGTNGQWQDNLHSTRLQAVAAGATSVTVNPSAASQPVGGGACSTIATCAALFTVGQWAMISGFDTQGAWQNPFGFPSNPFYFQYVLVTNVNTSTGVITFSAPVKDSYKTTWPNYNSGSGGEVDNGGPATLYALHPTWDAKVEWRGLVFTSNNEIDAPSRSATFRDVSFTAFGQAGVYPSVNQVFQIFSGTMIFCTMESDKLVESMSLNSVTIDQINFQSSSIKSFNAYNTTIRNLIGTPLTTSISNSNITGSFFAGATSHGRADSVNVINSSVGSVGDATFHTNYGILFQGTGSTGVNNELSMSGGIITIPNTYVTSQTAIAWTVPGNNLCWADANYVCAKVFQITDVTQDATNTYVHTTEAGTFPVWAYFNNHLWIAVHPAPQITFTNVVGSASAIDLSGAPPNAPLFSYSKRTYNNAASATAPYWGMWGTISKMNINVTAAYGGATSPAVVTPGPIGLSYLNTSYGAVTYSPSVNLKVLGLRSLDASGGSYPVSWGGTQSGDTLANQTQALWAENLFQSIMTDLSGDPSHPFSVSVEFITNQGVVIP